MGGEERREKKRKKKGKKRKKRKKKEREEKRREEKRREEKKRRKKRRKKKKRKEKRREEKRREGKKERKEKRRERKEKEREKKTTKEKKREKKRREENGQKKFKREQKWRTKMITRLHRLTTGLSIIQEIPEMFFREIENSVAFGNHLFPAWTDGVFGTTSLNNKFEAVYNKYIAIRSKANRDRIVSAFTHCNQIENLCTNQASSLIIELTDLPKTIQKELDSLFLHLYNKALNFHLFETHVADTLKNAIDRFTIKNGIEVCPFCGLEGFLNIEGQSRIALDHWLCKDLFPMTAVNFDNLFPIGAKCNERPAKGSKNILIDNAVSKNRTTYLRT